MQNQQAENEADRLSQGVTSTTPDEIMREMGSRLGADFSNVQFHSDSLSMTRSQALGARAWAQGSDVYFGKGGFDPKVAAHELVHTVQQGAVKGSISESVPMGTVQMLPLKNEGKVKRFDNNTDFGQVMGEVLSTEFGDRIKESEDINFNPGNNPELEKFKNPLMRLEIRRKLIGSLDSSVETTVPRTKKTGICRQICLH